MEPTKRFKMDRAGKTLLARPAAQGVKRGSFRDVRGLIISAQLEEEVARNAKAARKEEPAAA